MNFKIDTKEKFTVITPLDSVITANMTEEWSNMLLTHLQKDIPHIILKMTFITSLDESSGRMITNMQQKFYEHNCSFVICDLQKTVENKLDQLELLEILNVTRTESEAWDIVQMEEIERELPGDEHLHEVTGV